MQKLFECIERITGHPCMESEMHEIIDNVKSIDSYKTFDLVLTEFCIQSEIKTNAWKYYDKHNDGDIRNIYLFENYLDFVSCKIQVENFTVQINEFKDPIKLQSFLNSFS